MEYIKENIMLKHSSYRLCLSAAVLLCALITSPFASAGCGCPDDGHGTPIAPPVLGGTGLGEPFPVAIDVAPDPAWQVYEFARDGIRYVQVNDKTGRVRAAVGKIDGMFWVLPIGSDAEHVSVLSPTSQPTGSRSIYRSRDVEVVLIRSGHQDRWIIRQPDATQ
jgi:hypothetical protein